MKEMVIFLSDGVLIFVIILVLLIVTRVIKRYEGEP